LRSLDQCIVGLGGPVKSQIVLAEHTAAPAATELL